METVKCNRNRRRGRCCLQQRNTCVEDRSSDAPPPPTSRSWRLQNSWRANTLACHRVWKLHGSAPFSAARRVFPLLYTVRDIKPGTSNKLLLSNVDCCSHNETMSTRRHIETHAIRPEWKQTSEAAHSHYTISPPDPHFSLKHFLMTEQTNPNISNCLAFGGGWVGVLVVEWWGQISNHILFLLLYVWAGRRRCGDAGCRWRREREGG